ncbi:MAG: hypothetical protein ACKOYN_10435 [Planctomycetota bacterium]
MPQPSDEALVAESRACGDGVQPSWSEDALLAQFSAARREIELRIAIQSAIVLLVGCGAMTTMALGVAWPGSGMRLAACYALTDLLLALHWMHNDVRHAQLGLFLEVEIEPRLRSRAQGWEAFHRTLPPLTVLGSHWWVGTKGMIAASPTLVAAMAMLDQSSRQDFGLALSCVAVSFTILLFTRLPRFSAHGARRDHG